MVQAVDSNVRKIVYEFLNELRDMGTVNMFSASSDLHEEFGFNKSTCRSLLSDWMRDYEEKSWDEDSDSVILMVDGDEDDEVDEDELPERKY
tara:strand:+ start:510 stop:785 length:276 start_codon:yes stop_codon:yes gene_type:complete